jgi:hypothetical protein
MVTRKREDTAEGCRALAREDRARAAAADSDHMRDSLERSADAWIARAMLLERLEDKFNARAHAYADEQGQVHLERNDNG